jgi:hypothetical protein
MSKLSALGHDLEHAYKALLHGTPTDLIAHIRAAIAEADDILATATTWAQVPAVAHAFPDAHQVAQEADELRHELQAIAVEIDKAAHAAGKG